MTIGHDPLTPEERVLADRLERLGVPAGPPSALDARILGAAHDAVRRSPARRRPARWPLAFGAAASVALAVGVAWQLRPAQDTLQAYEESAVADMPKASGPSAADLPAPADAAAAQRAVVAAPAAAAAPPQDRLDVAAIAAPPAPMRAAPEDRAEAPAEEAAQAFPEAARAAPPPPPSAPPAPLSAANAGEDIVFDAPAAAPAPAAEPGAIARDVAARERRESSEKSQAEASELDRISVTGSRIARDAEGFSDAELDDAPPATAASPQVQRAWLQRIREMVAEGDLDGARASLGEFKRRYPRYALPDDLRALLP